MPGIEFPQEGSDQRQAAEGCEVKGIDLSHYPLWAQIVVPVVAIAGLFIYHFWPKRQKPM
jgi:hypothetical protein